MPLLRRWYNNRLTNKKNNISEELTAEQKLQADKLNLASAEAMKSKLDLELFNLEKYIDKLKSRIQSTINYLNHDSN